MMAMKTVVPTRAPLRLVPAPPEPRVLRLDDAAREAAVREVAEYLSGIQRDDCDREFFRNHPTVPHFPKGDTKGDAR